MHQQKRQVFLKDLYKFVQNSLGVLSKDAQRRAQAIQQSCDELRQAGASDEKVIIFEDILQNVAEAVRGWPQYSSDNGKKIAIGLLGFYFLLVPLIYAWGKPNTFSQSIAWYAVLTCIVFNLYYLAMLHIQEKLKIIATGCLLSLVQFIFVIGTICVIIAMLWQVLPSAVVVLLLVSTIGFLILALYLFRGAIIAAHIRRVPPP